MHRSTLIDLKPFELNYDPFKISIDKCNESEIAIEDLSTKRMRSQ